MHGSGCRKRESGWQIAQSSMKTGRFPAMEWQGLAKSGRGTGQESILPAAPHQLRLMGAFWASLVRAGRGKARISLAAPHQLPLIGDQRHRPSPTSWARNPAIFREKSSKAFDFLSSNRLPFCAAFSEKQVFLQAEPAFHRGGRLFLRLCPLWQKGISFSRKS